MDPSKRITAAKALKHEWFREGTICAVEDMPTFKATNELSRDERSKMEKTETNPEKTFKNQEKTENNLNNQESQS